MTEFFMPGRAETTKLAVHGGLLALAAVAAGYNLCAFVLRGDAHLARNAAVYATLTALEAVQVEKHWKAR